MSYDLPPDALDRDLVFEFFWRFSVFECALKREGFVKADGYGNALPNWDAFASAISDQLQTLEYPNLHESLTLLREKPPRRQVVDGQRLAWESVKVDPEKPSEIYIVKLVQVIRNNLFHGGKYPDGPIADVERDQQLLRAALHVIEAFYELHPGLKQWARAA